MKRADLWLLIAAIAGGTLFFATVRHLWPLADADVNRGAETIVPCGRQFLEHAGFDVQRHTAASALVLDSEMLDYLVRKFGQTRTQAFIRAGEPIFVYEARFKRRGDPDWSYVELNPPCEATSFGRTVQEDAPGATLDENAARRLAAKYVTAGYNEKGVTHRDRPSRRDHVFTYERYLSEQPELRERLQITISGDQVTSVVRALVLPESARREQRAREAPIAAMQMASFILLGIAGLAALTIFLKSLQRGEVFLKRAAILVAVIASFFVITQSLRAANLLAEWDPLWPRWVANFQSLGFTLAQGAWIAAALFIVIAAGDALDRRTGANRGRSLWKPDPSWGVASARGFLVGLICGGAMAATLLLLERVAGAWVSIQPQGFFFFAINSTVPALSTLLYFFMVALVEELAYRFFAGTWLLSLTGKKWIAILIPAILYGASHTGLEFLPPAEPFWGRAVVLTVVGCVWGWAFLRYDALTVVLSHFTADLFVFNWARLGSHDPMLMTKAIATMMVPLAPALVLLIRRPVTR